MAAQFLFDFGCDHRPGLAVGDAVDQLDRLVVQSGKLEQVAVLDEVGDRPDAGGGHIDLSLDQRLGHVEVGEQLATGEQLGFQAAAGCGFEFSKVVANRDVAPVAGGGVEGAAQADGLVGADMDGGQGKQACRDGAAGEKRHGDVVPGRLGDGARRGAWAPGLGVVRDPARVFRGAARTMRSEPASRL